MKHSFIYINIVLLLCSCTEYIELEYEQSKTKHLAVDAVLHNIPILEQTIYLHESTPYFNIWGKTVVKGVSGAKVTVSSADEIIEFLEKEDGEPGVYYGPEGYVCESGNDYHLHIERYDDEGVLQQYDSDSNMPESAVTINMIDYKQTFDVLDSSITLGVWADVADIQTNLAAFVLSNGKLWPFDHSMGLDTKYYRGKSVSAFPIFMYVPTWERYNAGELYAKPLEEDDFIIMAILTLSDDFYNYYMSYYYSSQTNKIPLLASQPANMPCNIKGKDVVGYFATAPAEYAMCFVTDPDKKHFDFDDE